MKESSLGGAGHRKRLRERFQKAGLSSFAPHEVIELLLILAIPRRDVKPISYALLGRFGSLRGILEARSEDMAEVDGVGESAVFAFQFIRSLLPHLLEQDLVRLPLTLRGDFLAEFWRYRIGFHETEVFEVAHFDPGMKLLPQGVSTHSIGSADRAVVFSKEIVRFALKKNAYAVAFAHNHPSGDPSPSDADILITKQLVLAASSAQIKVLDHSVVTSEKVFSFRKEGLL